MVNSADNYSLNSNGNNINDVIKPMQKTNKNSLSKIAKKISGKKGKKEFYEAGPISKQSLFSQCDEKSYQQAPERPQG
jgi:hypothetical protein